MNLSVVRHSRIVFRGPHLSQNWSLPESNIYYIAKNPSNAVVYQKLIRSCKYFYAKNPITVCQRLVYDRVIDELEIRGYVNLKKPLDFNDISIKLWITYSFYVENEDCAVKRKLASNLIPNIFRCDAEWLSLWDQDISFNDFFFLSRNAQHIDLRWCNLKNDDGSVVSLEKLVEHSSQALTFEFHFKDADSNISSESVKNLLKIPHFKTLNSFQLWGIPDTFDIATFYDYIKKNQNTRIRLSFSETISEELQNRLQTIVNEILETAENRCFRIPLVYFPGHDNEKFVKLLNLYWK